MLIASADSSLYFNSVPEVIAAYCGVIYFHYPHFTLAYSSFHCLKFLILCLGGQKLLEGVTPDASSEYKCNVKKSS